MGTLYIIQDDAFIGKTDERLNVKAKNQMLQDVPLIKVDGIVVLGRATISPAAIAELLERKIPLTFLSKTGEYLGKLEPEFTKNIFVRSAQWKAAGESEQAVHLVRGFVRGKLKVIASLDKTNAINSLRGLEGAGSGAYFSVFQQLIRTENFSFRVRHRPATDPVNSLLNFGYTLLSHDVQSAVNIVGFDPYLGYLHCQHYGRPGLALDLMEEFRPLVVDAMVLSAINLRMLTLNDFTTEPLSQVVRLSQDGRREFLKLYEKKKQSEFKHPVLGRKCTYQEAFEIQARLLAKYLMGEIEKYPPLVLK